MRFEVGGLVRFNLNGKIWIRRIHHIEDGRIYYYEVTLEDEDSWVYESDACDQLVYAGEEVLLTDTGEIAIVRDVEEDFFTTTNGLEIHYENWNGKLAFNVKEKLPEITSPEKLDDNLEQIVDQCCLVLNQADYSHKRENVRTMVQVWWENKRQLIETLRKHPAWNEEHLCIEGRINEVREKEDNIYLNAVKTMYGNCRRNGMRLTDEQLDIMWDCVECLAPEKNITQRMIDKYVEMGVEKTCGFVPHVGEKYSRVLNRVFKSFGLDKYENYNKDFAVVSDAINPIDNKQRCILSVHPCDYLKMSWGEKWNSCHDIRSHGCYHAGTQSYMMDGTSMIFYTVSNSGNEVPWANNKLTRQVFCYDDGKLLQSRCYPSYEISQRCDEYLNFVSEVIKAADHITDNWVMHTHDRMDYVLTKGGSTHYPDYSYDQYKTRVVTAGDVSGKILVGHSSLNLLNGVFHSNHEEINASSGGNSRNLYQDSYYVCEYCGRKFYQNEGTEYAGYDSRDGDFYCEDHYRTCDKCGETIYGDPDDVGRWCNDLWYCDYCADHHLVCCDHCDEYFDPEEEGDSDDYGHYCQSCVDDAEYCDSCGRYSWDYDYTYLESEGQTYCPDCLERLFTVCDECDEYVRRDNAREHDGDCLCPSCFAAIPRIEIEETPETPVEPEVSEAETTNRYRIINPLLKMSNPTTAYQMGYDREKFVASIIEGDIGELVNTYSVGRVTVYILKVSGDNYVAVQSGGCQKVA